MTYTIEASGLSRHFGDFVAVDQLDLSIKQGEIFGLLGPNAAGKSTTIRLLAGILRPDGGEVCVLGYDLFRQTETIKRHIGYVAQNFALYADMTVYENLSFYAGLYGVSDRQRYMNLLETYDLEQFRNRAAGKLSGGYKRRLSIACATAHRPKLLFLDEPTAGIDPVTRKELWDLFYRLSTDGITLFVTTHYMEEAERCHRLAFINHGRSVIQGTPQAIRDSLTDHIVYACNMPHQPSLLDELNHIDGVSLINQFGDQLRIITDDTVTIAQVSALVGRFDTAARVEVVQPGIEDAFMALTAGKG